jgi:D-amino peptidase
MSHLRRLSCLVGHTQPQQCTTSAVITAASATSNSVIAAASSSSGSSQLIKKVYISVDIEGVTGTTHWDEAAKSHPDYAQFRERMTAEAVAACDGALAAGAREIWIKDAHGSGRNILQERLPPQATLIRGWSGHPYAMVQELDGTFDAVVMIGYHGPASDGGNPLSHTYSGRWNQCTLNGELCPEYWVYAHCAALEDVPVVFVSGDAGICAFARARNPLIETVVTNTGHGDSVIATAPSTARDRIRAGVTAALSKPLPGAHPLPSSPHYSLSLRFRHHGDAFAKQFYPGARLADTQTVCVESDNFMDIATVFQFF